MAEAISYKPISDGDKGAGRPLGMNEAFMYYLGEVMEPILCYHMMFLETSSPLTLEHVRQAVTVTVRAQEILRMKIVIDKSVKENPFGYRFVPVENPEEILDVRSADPIVRDDWPTLLRDISKIPLDEKNGQLYRVTLVPIMNADKDESCYHYMVVLTIHHAIVDGKSGFDFLYRQLYPVLSAVVNEQDTTDILPSIPLVDSYETALVKEEGSTPWYFKVLVGALRWKNRKFGVPPAVELKYPDEPSRAENNDGSVPFAMPLVLSRDVTSALLKCSKQHGVSVHSVLLVASSVALYGAYQDANIKPPSPVKMTWPIDMRVHAGLKSPQPLSTYNSQGESKVKARPDWTQEKFWSTCKNVFSGVKKGAALKKSLEMAKLSRYFCDLIQSTPLMQLMEEFNLIQQGILSNLGNCNTGPEPTIYGEKCKIQMTHYCRAVNGMNSSKKEPYFYHGVSTFNGRLTWTVTFNTSMVSQKFLKNFLRRLEETVERYCIQS